MKLTPNATARRRTASAEAGSLGGPQIPSPVIRMAPKPRRRTVSSLPSETFPLEAVVCVATALFIFVLQNIRLLISTTNPHRKNKLYPTKPTFLHTDHY